MQKYDTLTKCCLTWSKRVLWVLVPFFFAGCWQKEEKKSKLVIINVLDKEYYDDCHITRSINIPLEDLEHRIKDLDKHDTYVTYCSNYACTAAPYVAKMLQEAGCEQVYVYHGGMVEWYQKKYPYCGPATMSYLHDKNEKLDEHDEPGSITAEALLEKMKQAQMVAA